MSATKPTILMVHGSWHKPIHYERLLALLRKQGYPTVCPLLPSVERLPPPVADPNMTILLDDAGCIEAELKNLIERDSKSVIVLAHSYGGIVTSQAVHESFSVAARKANGQTGGVAHILFLQAFLPALGQSLANQFGFEDTLPPIMPIDERGMCVMTNPDKVFYHDLSPEDQKYYVDLLVPCPAGAQLAKISYNAYTKHPATYLIAENDAGLGPLQGVMLDRIEKDDGVVIRRVTCDASHSPMISQPETIVKIVEGIAV